MIQKVRIGVVGTGSWVRMAHLPFLKSHRGASVEALCGRNEERTAALAKEYEIPAVFTDYREMIGQAGVDAVVVAVPDRMHHAVAMEALRAGKHVLCEKPLASNAQEAEEMCRTAESAGVKHMVFFTYRWFPAYRYLKQLVAEGYLGRCFHCDIRYLAGHGRSPEYNWRFDKRESNGALGDLGSHMIDLARWLFGSVTRVSSNLSSFVDRRGRNGGPVEPSNDAAMVMLEFENGVRCCVQVSAVAYTAGRFQEQHVVVHGSGGTLESDYSMEGSDFTRGIVRTPHVLRGAREGASSFEFLEVPGAISGGAGESSLAGFGTQSLGDRLFIDSILEDRPVEPGFDDGWQAQRVIDAAIESDRTRQAVSLVP